MYIKQKSLTNGVSFPPTIEIPRPWFPFTICMLVGFFMIMRFFVVASSSSSTGSNTLIVGESVGEIFAE